MIEISDEHAKEFQKIMKEEYGEDISISEAKIQGGRLTSLFMILIEAERKQKEKKSTPDNSNQGLTDTQ